MMLTALFMVIPLAYGVLIALVSAGWFRQRFFRPGERIPETRISVVISIRNESENMEGLLSSLLAQQYPSERLEVILTDDHSTDDTLTRVNSIMAGKNPLVRFRILSSGTTDPSGKKAALSRGIAASNGELIVVTDADCRADSYWLRTLADFYETHRPELILAPVRMESGGTFFGQLQGLEFSSLIASAAGSCSAGFPLMANGANMAFTRKAYDACGGFTAHLKYPSGDDMFLMMSIMERFGNAAVRFIKSAQAIVRTPAEQSFSAFVRQRIRWVSKSRGYKNPVLIFASFAVFFVNALMVLLLAAALSRLLSPTYFLSLWLFKTVADLPLMISFNRFQKTGSRMWLFPLMEILNAVYTLLIGIAGNLGHFEWKGRKY
jgi:cellulose synthase/poly-beta-1,6-N-acetylglucosamine synthase-like glycosyltransferase